MKTVWKVTNEEYCIDLMAGFKRRDAERACKEYYYAGAGDPDTFGPFDTLEEAEIFAKSLVEEIKKFQGYPNGIRLEFNYPMIDEVEVDDDGEEVDCNSWGGFGPTYDELMAVIYPEDDEDEESEDA